VKIINHPASQQQHQVSFSHNMLIITGNVDIICSSEHEANLELYFACF